MTYRTKPLRYYSVPPAEVASLTGSIFAGASVPETVARFEGNGWELFFQERINTPYGLGPLVNVFKTPSGRHAMWIPFYGAIAGQFRQDTNYPRDLFWILWKAGVKVIVCGSVHGSADWREPGVRIEPRDVVIPWSFWREYPMAGSLPGTEIGGFYPVLALMGDAYCKVLGEQVAQKIEADLTPDPIRKVHRPRDVQAFAVCPLGNGGSWESDAETNVWRRMCRMISQDGEGDLVPLFGGVGVSPPLARKLGAHLVLYHVCTDFAHGVAETADEVVEHIDDLYLNVTPPAFTKLEAEFIDRLNVPDDCTCMEHRRERPRQYLKSFTQNTPSGL